MRLPEPIPALRTLRRLREPGDEDGLFGLDRNERLAPLPAWFVELVRASLDSDVLREYPKTDALYRRLSAALELPEAQLLLTAGSDAAVKALYHAYIRPGDGVVMLDPSYAMYAVYAQMFQAQAHPVQFNRQLDVNAERLLQGVRRGVRMVLLANPNQPTGTLLDEGVLRRLADRTGAVGALLVIDEAYYPFSHTTVLPWVQGVPHLVVLRTFSKAAGLAGVRIGLAAAHPQVIAALYKVRSVHDVNAIAILCASHVLERPQIVTDYVAQVEAGRRVLEERARALGLVPLPTHTNFLLIRVSPRCRPAPLVEGLRRRGFLVKGPLAHSSLYGCIRVTLGPPALMGAFADALAGALTQLADGEEGAG